MRELSCCELAAARQLGVVYRWNGRASWCGMASATSTGEPSVIWPRAGVAEVRELGPEDVVSFLGRMSDTHDHLWDLGPGPLPWPQAGKPGLSAAGHVAELEWLGEEGCHHPERGSGQQGTLQGLTGPQPV